VKIDAYDYSRFGAIKGEVARVSPSTFKDPQNGQAYFKATIKPESEFVGDEKKGQRIKVGMTAEADITTGEKTIFQYLLKPVYTTVDTALSER
jgi:multidrug efflux pump subunit AcrA (membrane-fusion protein)